MITLKNKIAYLLFLGFFSCTFSIDKKANFYEKAITFSVLDTSQNKKIYDFKFYEVTNLYEGTLFDLTKLVDMSDIRKDNNGKVSFSIDSLSSSEKIRKFVFEKPGYHYTRFDVRNTVTDTLVFGTAIKPK